MIRIIGGFAEAEWLTATLDFIEVEAFQHVIQWIGIGDIVLEEKSENLGGPSSGDNREPSDARKEVLRAQIHKCIDFLIAADFLYIVPNPTLAILEKINGIMKEMWIRNPVTPSMVTKVWELPSTHPARDFFAKACAGDYLISKFDPHCPTKFLCTSELESTQGFSTQVLKVVAEIMADPITKVNSRKELTRVRVRHPLHGYLITIRSSDWSQDGVMTRQDTLQTFPGVVW